MYSMVDILAKPQNENDRRERIDTLTSAYSWRPFCFHNAELRLP